MSHILHKDLKLEDFLGRWDKHAIIKTGEGKSIIITRDGFRGWIIWEDSENQSTETKLMRILDRVLVDKKEKTDNLQKQIDELENKLSAIVRIAQGDD